MLAILPQPARPDAAADSHAPHTEPVPALFLVIPTLVLGLMGLLLYRRLVRAPRYDSPWVRFGAIAAIIALSAAVFVGFAYQNASLDGTLPRVVGAIGMTWLATAFYLLIGALLTAVVALGLRLAGRGDAVRGWHRRSVPVIVAASLLITAYGFFESRWLQVSETMVAIEGLPVEFEGYRVAVIADLHAGPIRGTGLTREVVDEANNARPDLILLAGDLTDGTTRQFGGDLAPLADLSAPDGVYAATGNHEYYAGDAAGWVSLWRELGLLPLLNESAIVERGSAALRVAGVSDEAGEGENLPELRPDLTAALAEVTPDQTAILIAHQPGVGTDPQVSEAGVDLMVSGHTHGGQIWPFTYVVKLANPTVSGLDEIDGTTAYTTRGAGTWGPPLRVLVPPEISILTLTRG